MVGDPGTGTNQDAMSFAEWKAQAWVETWAGGAYIVDGDTPIFNDKQLFEAWQNYVSQGGLIVNTVGGADDKWDDAQKLDLTYCVSDDFGANKPAVLAAMTAGSDHGWSQYADVKFVYAPAQDGSCTTANGSVLFDVRPVSGQSYLARSFFPSTARSGRELLIDTSAFGNVGWPLGNILGHEMGHILGFRHEHTRPEAGTCFEDNNWRALTPYDAASIMHYPQCNGSSQDLSFTLKDAQGAAILYGAPGSSTGGGGGGGGGNGTSTAQTAAIDGTVAAGGIANYQPISVAAGTTVSVVMSGSGDPDLYVRFGAAPTSTRYACRPYLNGPDESCAVTVPAGQTAAYLQVRGYAASTFHLDVSWTAP
jgi:hypothetical protein